eukprot:353588-Chlamydomonas_euryale.AAC.17
MDVLLVFASLAEQSVHLHVRVGQVRLSEVMAYADIPPSMRPALSEFDLVASLVGAGAGAAAGGVGGAGTTGGGGGLSPAALGYLESAKSCLFKALNTLRGLKQALGERGLGREAASADDAAAQVAEAQKALTQLGA